MMTSDLALLNNVTKTDYVSIVVVPSKCLQVTAAPYCAFPSPVNSIQHSGPLSTAVPSATAAEHTVYVN